MPSFGYNIRPLQYNSQCIDFTEWILLYTLCLAPLIAHIASGTPPISYLTQSRPKWYHSLCHYNPTSILWRYAAITDRRIRALHWGRDDLAASNAIFWTSNGWAGDENMVDEAAPYCLRRPELSHVGFISVTMLQTIITTMQGIAALFPILAALIDPKLHGASMAVDMIFSPLAILGLLRLCAATWLTVDFVYASKDDVSRKPVLQNLRSLSVSGTQPAKWDDGDGAFDPFLTAPLQLKSHFKKPNASWPSRIFSAFYLLIVGGIWAICVASLWPTPNSNGSFYTTTAFLTNLFYLILLSASLVIHVYYLVRGKTTSTIIPCISTTWYKIYTLLVMGSMLVLIIIASIETNRAPKGSYESYRVMPELACNVYRDGYTATVGTTSESMFSGLFSNTASIFVSAGKNHSGLPVTPMSDKRTALEERSWLYDFAGYCVGNFKGH